MVYVLHGQLFFSAANRRDAVLSDIRTNILGKNRFITDAVPEVLVALDSPKYPGPGIAIRLTFTNTEDAQVLQVRIESFAAGGRAPIAGSWVTLESSRNDEDNTTPDFETYRREW